MESLIFLKFKIVNLCYSLYQLNLICVFTLAPKLHIFSLRLRLAVWFQIRNRVSLERLTTSLFYRLSCQWCLLFAIASINDDFCVRYACFQHIFRVVVFSVMGREIENQTRHLHVTATNALCFYLFWQTIQHLLAGMFFTITHII